MAMLSGASQELSVPCADAKKFIAAVGEYNSMASLFYTKKTAPKKPSKQVDVKEFIPEVVCEESADGVKLCFDCKITPAGTLKAHDLLKVFKEQFGLDFDILACDVMRTRLYKEGKQSLLSNS